MSGGLQSAELQGMTVSQPSNLKSTAAQAVALGAIRDLRAL